MDCSERFPCCIKESEISSSSRDSSLICSCATSARGLLFSSASFFNFSDLISSVAPISSCKEPRVTVASIPAAAKAIFIWFSTIVLTLLSFSNKAALTILLLGFAAFINGINSPLSFVETP